MDHDASPPHQPVTFESPPVTEVGLAVQLDRPAVDLQALGLYAGRVKETFPRQEAQPPLPPMTEPVSPVPEFQLTLGAPPQFPRTWFTSEDAHHLIQVQSDRLGVNWRRLDGGQEYPRYTALREWFAEHLGLLDEVLHEAGREPVFPNFCELLYVNEIVVPGTNVGDPHPPLHRVVELVQPLADVDLLSEPEDAQLQARWRIPEKQLPDGSAIGRLYATLNPAFRLAENLPIYQLTLAARIVPPAKQSLVSMLDVFDVGHDWIVRGFKDLTTAEMHEQWGLTDQS